MSQKRAPAPPPAIPGYTYVSLLGSGGFADVFLYEQQRPRRRVAVKVLLQDMLTTGARRQFDAEANLMAQLSTHPTIVTIYEAAIATDGRPYLAMEYCSRPNLGVSYRREQVGVADALRIGIQVAGAVETAHRAGILHRDIKPANILVTEYNRPALTDFGISATTEDASMPAEGMSIPWSPPESFDEPPSSGRTTDVWALAATIYSLLAGRSPFEIPGGANSGADLISRIERAALPRIGRADVPDSLERVLATAMAKTAGGRYSTALAFARALQQVQTELQLAVTTVDVLDDVLVTDAVTDADEDEDEHDPGTRIRSILSIDPTKPSVSVTTPNTPDTTVRQTRSRVRPTDAISSPDGFVSPVTPSTVQGTNPLEAPPEANRSQTPPWGDPPSTPAIDNTILRPNSEPAEPKPDPEAETSRRRIWGWVAAIVPLLAVAAAFGVYQIGTQKADAPPERPMITQAQAALMKNYDAINNKANAGRDSKLLATVAAGDLLAMTDASYRMSLRLGEIPSNSFTSPNPIAFAPPAGGYPHTLFVYSKISTNAKTNVLHVFRRSDAAAPWKKVIMGSSEELLPPIAVDPSGLATVVAPGASGYAVKPIDVAPLLAKAMLSAKSPEGAKFAPSPILAQSHTDDANAQAAVKGHGGATQKFAPTKDIYAIKTQDGGVLVTGGMGRQVAQWSKTKFLVPEASWDTYRLHRAPYQSVVREYNAMWAVHIPVKGPLKLVLWENFWANFSAS